MTDWKSMDSAPRGPVVMIKTRGGHEFAASWDFGYEGEDGPCGCWAAVHEDEAPDCWTDGVCWASNDAGVPSDQPVAWRPR